MPTLAVGAGALALVVALRRFAPRLPGFLAAIVASSLAASVLGLPVETIGSRFPDIPSGLPAPALPNISVAAVTQVLPSAFTIAFLAGIEALLSAVVADGMAGTRHRSSQELVGQGVANIGSALFGGLPATGAIARTATNVRAGGRTPVAGIMHALFLLLFVLFATDLMAYVPMAALAAILFVVAWGMSEIGRFIALMKLGGSDRTVLLLTFVLTVFVDLTVAIGVGVTVASLVFMARMSEAVEFGDDDGPDDEGQEEQTQRDSLPPGVEVFRINGPLFFGVAGELLDTLRRMGQKPGVIILRMRLVPLLDVSGITMIKEFVEQTRLAGTRLILSGVRPEPRAMLSRAGLVEGEDLYFVPDYRAALALASSWTETRESR